MSPRAAAKPVRRREQNLAKALVIRNAFVSAALADLLALGLPAPLRHSKRLHVTGAHDLIERHSR